MSVSPADVKKLRDQTGAGMLDCKKALIETNGDFAEAELLLKKQGLATADKKAGRATSEGSVFFKISADCVVLVELTCETDFVAKTDQFIALGNKLATMALDGNLSNVEDESLIQAVKEGISILNENMMLKSITNISLKETQLANVYLHNGGTIAVLTILDCGNAADKENQNIKELGFDLALHAAAFNPPYLSQELVPEEYLNKQKSIFEDQSKELAGKPQNVIENIMKGKINKHLAQICMLDQGFVKDDKVKVQNHIAKVAKDANTELSLSSFVYLRVGEA